MELESVEPQRHTGFMLRRAQQRHVAVWQQLIPGDATNVQYGVLAVLERQPGIAQKELCEELDLDRSTIADVCSRLERQALVSREPAPEDRRRNVLNLTAAGQAKLDELRPLVTAVQREMTSALSTSEHEQLRSLLAKLLG